MEEATVQALDLVGAIAGQRLEALIDVADPKIPGRGSARDNDPSPGPREGIDEDQMPSSGAQGIEGERRQARGRFQNLLHEGLGLARPTGPDRKDAQLMALMPDNWRAPPESSRIARTPVSFLRARRMRCQIHNKDPTVGFRCARGITETRLAEAALEIRPLVFPQAV